MCRRLGDPRRPRRKLDDALLAQGEGGVECRTGKGRGMITRLMTIALALTVPAAARAQDAAAPSAKNDAAVDPAALAAAKHLIAPTNPDATPHRLFVGMSQTSAARRIDVCGQNPPTKKRRDN